MTSNELRVFTKNAGVIAEWLIKKKIVTKSNEQFYAFCCALKLWTSIEEFLKKMVVKEGEEEEHVKQMDEFEANVTEFYKFGGKSFLNKDGHIGFYETTYMHALRFYMPKFSKDTWTEHRLPLGIYTMQGFERRNKESKNMFLRHTNNKKNPCMQTLALLYESWKHG